MVDPLDGTVNYLYGVPQWCVSIAVESAERTLAAVVYDPLRDEAFCAVADGEATVDGEPLTGSGCDDVGRALVATGFGYESDVRRRQAAVVARVLPAVRDIRRAGSAALDLAWVAAGRLDAYYERGVKPWDVAAGLLVCERAGLGVRRLAAARRAAGAARGPCRAGRVAVIDFVDRRSRKVSTKSIPIPGAGVEPARPCGQGLLRAPCLPFHHPGEWWSQANAPARYARAGAGP